MTHALKTFIELWLNKAEHDLLSAQRKAFLVYHGRDIERTHNIIFLLSECANFDPVFAAVDPMNINAYAVQGRYPDSNLIPTIDEAKSYYQLAIQVRDLVVERIVFA